MSTSYTLWNNKPGWVNTIYRYIIIILDIIINYECWKFSLLTFQALDNGNVKKDIFNLIINGIGNVDFFEKDISSCLTSGVVGNLRMEVDNDGIPVDYQDLTNCATSDKTIGY